jgi:hypothetical protein
MAKSKNRRIENPFVLHEGQFYLLPDWYAGKLTTKSILLLHPLDDEETDKLLSLRGTHLREAYAAVLPMVQRRELAKYAVQSSPDADGDDDGGDEP